MPTQTIIATNTAHSHHANGGLSPADLMTAIIVPSRRRLMAIADAAIRRMRNTAPARPPLLISDGEDVRKLPLSMRKANLARLLARRVDGIHLADFEQGEIGPDLFRHACLLGLEGMVSKHRESLYRGGRFRH